ncbi:hypothetical protein [Klebsiella electrica]|uniref:hypothetical protein n=1 Tax=Klebsiella electrica TaxID=1259973 RepID=UPI0011515154|nr:hypothetical protein [Klebsiella electrica]
MIAHSPALFMIGVITLIALYHSALISNIQFLPLNKTGNTLLTSALFFPKNRLLHHWPRYSRRLKEAFFGGGKAGYLDSPAVAAQQIRKPHMARLPPS